MKRIFILLVLGALGFVHMACGQACVIDSQWTSAGIYPTDTLPPMQPGTTIDATFNMLWPTDTVLFGFTVLFDSATLVNVLAVPNYLGFYCGGAAPNCSYPGNPAPLFRACMRFTGTCSQQNPRFPAYDSIIVQHNQWVTTPFGTQSALASDTLWYRCGVPLGLSDREVMGGMSVLLDQSGMAVGAVVHLVTPMDGLLEIRDLYGRVVGRQPMGWLPAGKRRLDWRVEGLEAGLYVMVLRNTEGVVMAATKWRQL